MRFKINLPPETRVQETNTTIDTIKRPSLQDESSSHASQRSPDPPIKLFLKLSYPPAPFAPSSASNSGASFSTESNPTITTPRALACLIINSLVFAATLLSKSDTSAASQAAKFLIDQAQQFGDIGDSLQQTYDAGSGIMDGETFPDSLGNLFEAVFFSMSMLRHSSSDSADGVKIAVQYEHAFQRLSERDEEMDEDEDEGDEFVPTGFGFTTPAEIPGSLSDDWPHQDDLISFDININSWRRLAILSIVTFQFSAAIAQKLGAVEDALFLAQQAACLENMGESACRYTSIAGKTFFRSVERAKLYVFGILTGLWDEYKNSEDDIASVLGEKVGYLGIYEELKSRLVALGEPEGSGDSVSGEENEEEPDGMFMKLERIDLPDSDTTQETEDEFNEHELEDLDDITIPEIGMADQEEMQSDSEDDPSAMHVEQVDGVALSEKPRVHVIAKIIDEQVHVVPCEKLGDNELSKSGSTELRQETKAEISEMPLKNMLMISGADMTFLANGSANRVEDSNSELSEMSIDEFNTLVFMGSNKGMTANANENNDSAANDNVPISRTCEGGRKRLLEQPMPFECSECGRKFRTLDNIKAHQRTAVHNPFNCEDCDKKFERDNELAEHQQADCKPKLFQCSDCESKFVRKDGLLRHRRIVHGADVNDVVQKGRNKAKNKEFHCRECGRGYSRGDSLLRHERCFHGEDVNGKPFQCDSCGKRFARRDQLVKHEVYCNGSNVSESEMDEDEMEDDDEMDAIVKAVSGPPFHCDCGKSYVSLYNLSRHRRTCNGPVNEKFETRDGEEMDVDADGETDIEVDIEKGEVNDWNELSDTK